MRNDNKKDVPVCRIEHDVAAVSYGITMTTSFCGKLSTCYQKRLVVLLVPVTLKQTNSNAYPE